MIKAVCTTLFAALLVLILVSTSTKVFAQTNWEKYFGNPVIYPDPPGAWDDYWLLSGDVLFDGTTYHMWYSSWDSVNSRIGYATSPDGIAWTKNAENPVLDIGLPGSWDGSAVSRATVVYNESVYHMWYFGTDTSGVYRLGYATSPDGIVWTKYINNPVMDVGLPGRWDDASIVNGDVIFTNSLYQLWYTGWDSTNLRIGYATSPDGINWTKYAGNPVLDLGEAGSWDTAGVTQPTVVYHDGTYHLWYSGGEEMIPGIPFLLIPFPGYATSSDGINWTKYARNPISNDASVVSSGDAYYDGSTYHMWFSFCEWDGGCQFRIHYSTSALTFTVNSTDDGGDINPGDGVCDDGTGDCTLRAALMEANASAGKNEIAFDIPGPGPHSIQPASALPLIFDPVIIDGTTEPEFAGTPIIELDGSLAGSTTSGLSIFSGNSTVSGLVINRFTDHGISLQGSGGNVIEGNFIGTDVAGTIGLGNGLYGVFIAAADNNTIGGTTAGARNLISGNNERGIWIWNSSNNTISGNYIGTDSTGTMALGNVEHGIVIGTGSQFNIIGGTTEGERNIISGNGNTGIAMWNPGTSNNTISGNYIGTDVTGTVALGGQSWAGVFIVDEASFNTIGGTTVEERNIISGNNGAGITISDSGTTANIVIGNYIGTDATGTNSIGNDGIGVLIFDASNNIIGGTMDGARNIISANLERGVRIEGNNAQGNLMLGNYIGTDVTGMVAFPNLFGGIAIRNGASNNIIGGTETGARNVISGNNDFGLIIGDETHSNIVQGNYIGTDATGSGALGNQESGVVIFGDATNNLIGGEEDGAGNIIAYNFEVGVMLDNPTITIRNRISRNSIFSNGIMGIDLSLNTSPPWSDGVTPNDPGDPDIGPNNLQNFPVLTSSDIDINGDLLIGYNVDSEPVNSTYPLTIEFFESDTSGQGETFVGVDQYTVTDFNNGSKTVNIGNAGSLGIIAGDIIVATTTDSVGNTSEFSFLDTVVTDISETINNLPEAYALYQNYPNPFNPTTIIKYQIPELSFVTIKVYDVLGSEIIALVNEEKPIGNFEIEFDATALPSGIYFYRLQAGSFIETKKMVFLR